MGERGRGRAGTRLSAAITGRRSASQSVSPSPACCAAVAAWCRSGGGRCHPGDQPGSGPAGPGRVRGAGDSRTFVLEAAGPAEAAAPGGRPRGGVGAGDPDLSYPAVGPSDPDGDRRTGLPTDFCGGGVVFSSSARGHRWFGSVVSESGPEARPVTCLAPLVPSALLATVPAVSTGSFQKRGVVAGEQIVMLALMMKSLTAFRTLG